MLFKQCRQLKLARDDDLRPAQRGIISHEKEAQYEEKYDKKYDRIFYVASDFARIIPAHFIKYSQNDQFLLLPRLGIW